MTNELTAERLRELVAELAKQAEYTDRVFDNSSLGELYRKAHTAIIALMEREARMREALTWIAERGSDELALSQTENTCRIIIRHMAGAARAALKPKETDDDTD